MSISSKSHARGEQRGLRIVALTLVGMASWLGTATATVTQPNNSVVPIDSRTATGEKQVYDAFKQSDKTAGLRFREDANTAPEVFSPLCSFTAELLLKETASDMAVGWYNVIPGATTKPADTDIVEVIPRGAKPPAMITGQSIKDHPKYLGGLVGFAIITGSGLTTKFSERKWNARCTNTGVCPTPGNWVHSITYVSPTVPNAFYLGFEDGNSDANGFGNDGDYNDYFFLFTGLTCNGGGKPCTVPGEKGICSAGVAECNNAGGLTCKRVINPQPTDTCDGLDNDCNGLVDDGATCPAGQECDRGRCSTPCSAEFPCPSGLSCDRGRCVTVPCATGVVCQGDTVCSGDRCVSQCEGIVCPGSQICRVGRCVDPCSGVSCGAGKACVNGACVTGCDCYPCQDPALACSKSSNICVEKGCENLTCAAGYVCKGGECVAGCTGVVCPRDQECKSGACVDLPMAVDPTELPIDSGGGAIATGCSCRLSADEESRPGPAAWGLFGSVVIAAFLYTRKRRAHQA
ncbi:MAG TPA: hypothetical protein PKI03_23025 [Pseudomonadota bacterium]|nr:hypothetical protein [Pseudomonadota bacterium]